MIVVTTISALRAHREAARVASRQVALVPTMGALHAGHVALLDQARQLADTVVLSVFVNPLQFGAGEDFGAYPRDFNRDLALAAAHGVDVVFAPLHDEMYRPDDELRITAGDTAARWEGDARPGHFAGVLTVVNKLFNIVGPDVAVFGQKDIQQVTLIRRLVREFDVPVALCVVPTVRDADGLALSSRNAYLTPEQRDAALALSRALRAVAAHWAIGERESDALRAEASGILDAVPLLAPEYVAIVDPERLAPVARATAGTVVALAARVGATRLIDNIILGDPR